MRTFFFLRTVKNLHCIFGKLRWSPDSCVLAAGEQTVLPLVRGTSSGWISLLQNKKSGPVASCRRKKKCRGAHQPRPVIVPRKEHNCSHLFCKASPKLGGSAGAGPVSQQLLILRGIPRACCSPGAPSSSHWQQCEWHLLTAKGPQARPSSRQRVAASLIPTACHAWHFGGDRTAWDAEPGCGQPHFAGPWHAHGSCVGHGQGEAFRSHVLVQHFFFGGGVVYCKRSLWDEICQLAIQAWFRFW